MAIVVENVKHIETYLSKISVTLSINEIGSSGKTVEQIFKELEAKSDEATTDKEAVEFLEYMSKELAKEFPYLPSYMTYCPFGYNQEKEEIKILGFESFELDENTSLEFKELEDALLLILTKEKEN